jgi:hypothetical protein
MPPMWRVCIFCEPTPQPAVLPPQTAVANREGKLFHVLLGVPSRMYKQVAVWNSRAAQRHSEGCTRETNLLFLQRTLKTEENELC